jgi:SRSO17 transposase
MFAEVVAPAFGRREPRLRARRYLLGLVSGLERKNGWTIAEFAGEASPDGMQRLLNAARWDADEVRDRLRAYVVGRLGDERAVLVVDETGFAKKGSCSAGVQRQYSGTLGRIDNCQLGVFMSYASSAGRALIDRELYLPTSWCADADRCAAAGVPDNARFATKPELARRMLERATAAGTPFGWVTGDEAYGQDPVLRGWLETHGIGYVLAVARHHRIGAGVGSQRADQLTATLPASAWQRASCGPGSKGDRLYDWAWAAAGDHRHSLLVRRSIGDGDLSYYLCYAPGPVTQAELVRVAGSRWSIEECFQASKNETGLDHYQVRRFDAWHRHVTLSMTAHAWLAATAAATRPPPGHASQHTVGEAAKKGPHRLWTAARPIKNKHHHSQPKRSAAG